MRKEIFTASYSAQDAAAALNHPNLPVWRRDQLKTNNTFYLPRQAKSGPSGGEYRYLHLVEMAFAMALNPVRRPVVTRQVFAGLIEMLTRTVVLKKYNSSDEKQRELFDSSVWTFGEADHPVLGLMPDGTPVRKTVDDWHLQLLIMHPELAFGEETMSRDPLKPTHLLYNPLPGKDRISTREVMLVGNVSLTEARELYFDMRMKPYQLGLLSVDGIDQHREEIDEECDDLPIINLTTLLNRLERRLELRLSAQSIRGR